MPGCVCLPGWQSCWHWRAQEMRSHHSAAACSTQCPCKCWVALLCNCQLPTANCRCYKTVSLHPSQARARARQAAAATPLPTPCCLQVATLLIVLFGLGGGIGVVGGGALGQWLYNRRKEYLPLLSACCLGHAGCTECRP